ncbi:RuvC-like resolvase [Stenotrophomonas phage Summit]|nr:RuvC-like resolvase [Stenotrophomonas phage Summit]
MRTCGIDPSMKTGFVVLDSDGGVLVALKVEFAEARGYHRLQLIAKSLQSLVNEWKPDIVVVEGQGFANKFTKVEQTHAHMIVRQSLYNAGIGWYDAPPTTVKKLTTGKGDAKKIDMAKSVKERWGFVSKSDDVVDAYAMAQIARQIALTGAPPTGVKRHEEPALS